MWLLGFGLMILVLFVMAILGSVFNWDNSVLSFFVGKIWFPLFMIYALIYWVKTDIIDKRKESKTEINKAKHVKQDIKIEHNEITKKIIDLISEQLKENLSNVKKEEYEENGKVYYMNGQNGTFFDWTVNGRLPYFMVFYKDGSCGAIKVHVKTNGDTEMYFYKYGENKPFITKTAKFDKNDVLELAIILTKVADDKNIFDRAINDMNTNLVIMHKDVEEFNKADTEIEITEEKVETKNVIQNKSSINKGIEYIQKLKETYIKRGHTKEWEHLENIANGISESDKEKILKEYPDIPESLLEILNRIDGTYYRLYENEKITFYFFSSDVEEGKYPYYLLSSMQMLKDSSVKYLDCYINREYDDVPVSEEITNDVNNVKWLHFADCMNNGGTSRLYIDFSPSDKGKKGQIIRFLHDDDCLEVIANSFDELLDMIEKNGFKFIEDK